MCGRCRCTLRPDDIPRACHLDGRPVRHLNMDRYRPSYNVSPGWNMAVVRRDDGSEVEGVVVQSMKWGLVPSFTKKTDKADHFKMFNARSESMKEKASFRRLVPNSRCLVAVEGFYEWKKDGSSKQPYYIHFKDGRPLVFAALYDSWKNSEGDVLYTFTILTTSSSSALAWLHDRMPVVLSDETSINVWLNGSSSSKFESLLKPYEETDLGWYPVTPAMGKTSFDGPECIKEIQLKTNEIKPISKFFLKKESKSNQELEPPVSVCREPAKANTNDKTSLKVEPESKANQDNQSFTSISNCDSNYVSTATHEDVKSFQAKRDYKAFSAGTKPAIDETDELLTSPAKRKGSRTGGDDRQPTLFSYFGKR